jgi:hypothetical protein
MCGGVEVQLHPYWSQPWIHTRSLNPCGKSPAYQLDRRLCVLESWAGRWGVEKKFAPSWNQIPAVQPLAPRYADWALFLNGGFATVVAVVEYLHRSAYLAEFISALDLLKGKWKSCSHDQQFCCIEPWDRSEIDILVTRIDVRTSLLAATEWRRR